MYLSTFNKNEYLTSILVLGIHLEYLVNLSTWSTVLDPNPDVYHRTVQKHIQIDINKLYTYTK